MLLNAAVAGNPLVVSARASAQAAGYDLRTAKWQRFPGLSVELVEAVHQRPGLPYNRLYPTVNAEQPLWAGGRISGGIRQARSARQAAVAYYEASALQIALDVADSYHEVIRSAGRQALLAESLKRHRTMVETMERRVAAEVSPLADLELARSRLAQIEQQLSLTQAQHAESQEKLRELIGDRALAVELPQAPSPLVWPLFELDSTIDEARAFSPRLRQLQSETAAAAGDVQLARSALMPQLSGQYSYNDYQGARVGFVVRLQTGNGLSRVTAIDAARAREQASELRIAAGERDLRNQIVASQVEFTSATTRLPTAREAALASQRVYDSYLRQFISGRRSWLDVMNSFQETTSADISVVDTEANALAAMDRLLLLTGRWRLDIKDVP